eukprot:285708-Amphidinium_carterae.1
MEKETADRTLDRPLQQSGQSPPALCDHISPSDLQSDDGVSHAPTDIVTDDLPAQPTPKTLAPTSQASLEMPSHPKFEVGSVQSDVRASTADATASLFEQRLSAIEAGLQANASASIPVASGLKSCLSGQPGGSEQRLPAGMRADASETSRAHETTRHHLGLLRGCAFMRALRTGSLEGFGLCRKSQGKDDDVGERRARAVVGKFAVPLTRDEARKHVDDTLKLPDSCFVLTRGKYNERCTLVFSSPGECADYIKRWISLKPKKGAESAGSDERILVEALARLPEVYGVPARWRKAIAYIDKEGEITYMSAWPAHLNVDDASEWIASKLG